MDFEHDRPWHSDATGKASNSMAQRNLQGRVRRDWASMTAAAAHRIPQGRVRRDRASMTAAAARRAPEHSYVYSMSIPSFVILHWFKIVGHDHSGRGR